MTVSPDIESIAACTGPYTETLVVFKSLKHSICFIYFTDSNSEMMGHLGQYENIKNRQTGQLKRHESYCILDVEIDHSLESTLSSGLCDVTSKDIPLYGYSDVPEFLKGNPYVTNGYRVSLPFSLCLKRYVSGFQNYMYFSSFRSKHML